MAKLAENNVVRARIGIGLTERLDGDQDLTIMGMVLYGYENNGERFIGSDRFGSKATISEGSDSFEHKIVLSETMRFLIDFFDKFDDPLAIQNLSNKQAHEILRGIDPTGSMTIMDAIRTLGPTAFKVKDA